MLDKASFDDMPIDQTALLAQKLLLTLARLINSQITEFIRNPLYFVGLLTHVGAFLNMIWQAAFHVGDYYLKVLQKLLEALLPPEDPPSI